MSAAPPEPSWLASLQGLAAELPGLLSDRIELFSLELHRLRLLLVQMVALIVAAAILGVTAWLALWGVAVGGLIRLGLHWAEALTIVLLINLLVCAPLALRVRALAALLNLSATRRHLGAAPPHEPAAAEVRADGAV
jgi:uncharacterized membrane protein YqjE